MVYEILAENDLCQYYVLNENPGSAPAKLASQQQFAYLDDEAVQQQLLEFRSEAVSKATFFIPQVHCSSCIWLLENLPKLNEAVLSAKVDFLRKELSIDFQEDRLSLRRLVELLAKLGYEPQVNAGDLAEKPQRPSNKKLYIQIGVAGFCFGNIMLLSLPEYLDVGETLSLPFKQFFGLFNILLALPVLLFASGGYLSSAYRVLKHRAVNIDVPISIGIIALFGRSLFEISTGSGAGYMDSFAGLVFFLLLGKLFQQKTYDTLSFERDYKSFFPISVTRKDKAGETAIPLSKLTVGDRIIVRNGELIPADSILINGAGNIDYSFVTGEAEPLPKSSGDLIYAGGRQTGSTLELEIVKAVSQGYLTRLWNNDAFQKSADSQLTNFVNTISKYFTFGVIAIAVVAAMHWFPIDAAMAANAFTAVLIIACPCALALSTPFTLGSVMRIFGRNRFFLKNSGVIETLAKITTIIFDKTGTITRAGNSAPTFVSLNGDSQLSRNHQTLVKSLVKQSTHPLSAAVFNAIESEVIGDVAHFREVAGSGIEGTVQGRRLRIGSQPFVDKLNLAANGNQNGSAVYVSIDGNVKGYYQISNRYRKGLRQLLDNLRGNYRLALLSGDNDRERKNLLSIFGKSTDLKFNQSPQEKLDYVQRLQSQNETVLMIGDGLNDAGALKQSDAGISIAEDLNSFFPACDGILEGSQFNRFSDFLRFSRVGMNVIRINLGISLLYNIIGLSFAVQGTLSPLICAILMPLSSISVIVFATGITNLLARNYGLTRAKIYP
mgnify:CR=1 FL=1